MRLGLLAASLAMICGQVQALSCLRPDPIGTFQQLAAAPDAYFVLYGQLGFNEAALPPAVSNGESLNPDPIPARFVGKGLSLDGFTIPFASNVLLQIGCLGAWCGSARSGVDALYFVPASSQPLTFEAGPCGGMIFEEPTQEVLDMLTSCMQGGVCSAQPFQ